MSRQRGKERTKRKTNQKKNPQTLPTIILTDMSWGKHDPEKMKSWLSLATYNANILPWNDLSGLKVWPLTQDTAFILSSTELIAA